MLLAGDELEARASLTARSCFLGPRQAPITQSVSPQVYCGHPAEAVKQYVAQETTLPVGINLISV